MSFTIREYEYVKETHRELFSQFVYRTDKESHGLVEFWKRDEDLASAIEGKRFYGDCEEFARACMLRLMERGYKARLVYCLTELGDGHCVCEVASQNNREAYILDNRYPQLMTHAKLKGYKFISASQWRPIPGGKANWVALG